MSDDDQTVARTQLNIGALRSVPDSVAVDIKTKARTMPAGLAAAGVAAVPAAKPGTERWPVKTGVDDAAAEVGSNQQSGQSQAGIVKSTVEELIQLPRPPDMADVRSYQEAYQERRAVPVELTIWQVKADIIAIKKEADGDLHMVIQGDSGETMIAEAPAPKAPFVTSRSPWLDAMKTVRARISGKFGPSFAAAAMQPFDGKFAMPAAPLAQPPAGTPPAAQPGDPDLFEQMQPFKAKLQPTTATITGVGFFDRVHDQMGVAMKNGIELHPILDISFD